MHRLDQLEVDVHVVRHEAAPLEPLLLRVALAVPLRRDGLGEQLLDAGAGRQLHQRRVRLNHELVGEGAQAHPDQGAVVQDLRRDVHPVDNVPQVRHEQQVPRLGVPAVQRVLVHLAQQRARAGALRSMRVDAPSERVHLGAQIHRARHHEGIVLGRGGGRRGGRRSGRLAQRGLWPHRVVVVVVVVRLVLCLDLFRSQPLRLLDGRFLGRRRLGHALEHLLLQLHLALGGVLGGRVEERLLPVVDVFNDP
mmetsp:Transcript_33254/g.106088  ORF Transcript_33254/g.106088 Transcript_33254/m.106088 type:complete len:251 (+) Transcript_33254:755-1507(+)